MDMGATTWRQLNRRRDHRWARSRISEYVDGELAASEERRLAQHEELCSECARLIRELQILLAILPSLSLPPAASFEIAERTAERVRAQIGEWS
jgi:anti-sigma factor RsiW